MGEEYSVAELARELGAVKVQVASLQATQALNHSQNRGDIHDLRGTFETFTNSIAISLEKISEKISKIEIKNARWNVAAGVVMALLLKLIDHFIK